MDDIDKLLFQLEKDVAVIMNTTGDKMVKQIYKKHAEDSYNTYIPVYNESRYRNGVHGSFADEVNFQSVVTKVGDNIVYEMHNERTTDCRCAKCRANRYKIDGYIEDGVAGYYRIEPKDVYEKAQEEVDDNIEKIVNKELAKKGW